MRNIYDCVDAFQHLLDIEYHFIVGRKMCEVSFDLRFDKSVCYHLMGLQHLKDIDSIGGSRQKVFDRISARKIRREMVEASQYYPDVAERIHYLCELEALLDSNELVFKYHKRFNKYSRIEAEFLLESRSQEQSLYLFIDRERDGTYFCRSFFPKDKTDYTKNQPRYTLLYKEKHNLRTGEAIVQYDKLGPR